MNPAMRVMADLVEMTAGRPDDLYPVARLRAMAPRTWTKATFDRVVLAMAKAGRVVLHFHDLPSSVSAAVREMWVRDRDRSDDPLRGEFIYFHAIALPAALRE